MKDKKTHWGWWLQHQRAGQPKTGWVRIGDRAVTYQTVRAWERSPHPPSLNRATLDALAATLNMTPQEVLNRYKHEPVGPPPETAREAAVRKRIENLRTRKPRPRPG